jgi:hypothetical protein
VRTHHDRAVIVVGALTALSAGACSLLVSTNGLSGTESATAPADDAGGDVITTTDAGDSGRDGDSSCDAGFCACAADAHSFCDDFDGVPTGADWLTVQDPGGTLAYEKNGVFSPPISVLASADALASGNLRESLSLIQTPQVTRLRVELDMAIERSDPTTGKFDGTHAFCPLSITLQPGDQTIRINIYGDRADLEQLSAGNVVDDVLLPVPVGTGARGRYGVWFDTKARTCGATFNGVERSFDCKLNAAITGGAASVLLGIDFVRPPTSAWRVRMDNVTLDHD